MQRKIEYFQTEAGERDEWRVCNKGPVSSLTSLAWPGLALVMKEKRGLADKYKSDKD